TQHERISAGAKKKTMFSLCDLPSEMTTTEGKIVEQVFTIMLSTHRSILLKHEQFSDVAAELTELQDEAMVPPDADDSEDDEDRSDFAAAPSIGLSTKSARRTTQGFRFDTRN
ncbi:hypothetical protein LTS18_011032, partial [Coniosporium uncinatum]